MERKRGVGGIPSPSGIKILDKGGDIHSFFYACIEDAVKVLKYPNLCTSGTDGDNMPYIKETHCK